MDIIKELAKGLNECYERSYILHQVIVDRIIKFQLKDIDLIEHTLDGILDIYTEKGFYLFLRLLSYYHTINEERASAYLKIFQDYRKEECEEFQKKLKK